MKIEVRYFAAAREATGSEAESLEVPDATTVDALGLLLVERHPDLAALLPSIRYAVGERFAEAHAALAEGAVVALLPPVSGG
jgi:molybdopterin converting factor subunit 1